MRPHRLDLDIHTGGDVESARGRIRRCVVDCGKEAGGGQPVTIHIRSKTPARARMDRHLPLKQDTQERLRHLPLKQDTQERLQELFQEPFLLRSLPLVELRISCLALAVRTTALAATLHNTRATLRTLNLSVLRLDLLDGMPQLRASLESHPTLTNVALYRLQFPDGKNCRALAGIVKALATGPRIQTLLLGVCYRRHINYNIDHKMATPALIAALSHLCQAAPSFRDLQLLNRPLLGDDAVMSFCRSLTTSNLAGATINLKSLSFRAEEYNLTLGHDGVQALAELMASPHCPIEELQVTGNPNKTLFRLAKALQTNRHLKRLQIAYPGGRVSSISGLRALGHCDESVRAIWCETLRDHNFVLQDICFQDMEWMWHDASILFYLRLNRAGRQHLLGDHHSKDASCRDWVDAVGSCPEDPRVAFYFLSKNPSLCGRAALKASWSEEKPLTERPQKRQKRTMR